MFKTQVTNRYVICFWIQETYFSFGHFLYFVSDGAQTGGKKWRLYHVQTQYIKSTYQVPKTGSLFFFFYYKAFHFDFLHDSRTVFTCLLPCKQLRGRLLRIHERCRPAASAPRWWRCMVPNSAASAKYLHALQHQELPPAIMKFTTEQVIQQNILFTVKEIVAEPWN